MQTEAIRAARPQLVQGVVAALVTLTALIVADIFGQLKDVEVEGTVVNRATDGERIVVIGAAVVVLLAGVGAVRAFAAAVRKGSEARNAAARGAALAFITSIVGYAIVLLAALGVLDVDLGGLLVGGAVTGVVLGIAAQQTIGNFFAGIVLLVVRPFSIGEDIVLRSGPLGGEYAGTVTDMTIFYVHLHTETGAVALPNAGVLSAAIGPGARSVTNEDLPDDEPPA